ncbi:unnamed protein product [Durusdinium trenchii]|uniref:PPM-type phosphatase domain-containing protein n=1 Tax=Durusdinium trenchii TaxID=1381693 RepID=A0ABP0NZR0_9DINO
MWGVLIFLRFYYIAGQAGIWQTLCAVLLSFTAAFCTTAAMSSIASSGGLVSSGGPYYMISRALGPVIGATIGIMYWLAITMLSVLECLGAIEALAMAAPSVQFPGYRQALGSAAMASLAFAVWGGINIVTKLGMLFALVVVFTLFSFYLGLFMTQPGAGGPDVPGSEYITGLSWDTFQNNWSPHYDEGVHFGSVLSLFYPCFTGILSGANRADVLKARSPAKHPPRYLCGDPAFWTEPRAAGPRAGPTLAVSPGRRSWGRAFGEDDLMGDVEQGFSRAAGGYASTSGAAGPRTEAGRDRDPPPGYDGIDPETTFRQYEKQVALWEFETDVARAKRGVKLLRQLSGIAQTAVDHLEVDQITGEDGVKNLLTALREYFNPHLEVSLPRAFEAAVYGAPRASKETFGEFTKRMERAFVNLAKEGVDLPDGARGYIMYRQASLSESQEQRLLTWAQGCYGRKEMTVALRRLDKVIRDKEKGKSSFVMEEGHEAEVHTSEAYLNEDSGYPDDDDENFVYIADGGINGVLETTVIEGDESAIRNSLTSQAPHLSHFGTMAGILQMARGLVGKHPTVDPTPMDTGARVVNPKVPLRNWRVVLDKIATILVLAALQGATEEWCLELGPSQLASKSADSIEDYYAEVILRAAPLKPLKSKTDPTVSASSCIHPKAQLRGGGNGTSSYVVCRACHSRWALEGRAAEIRKQLKQGPLSTQQDSPSKTRGAMSSAPMTPVRTGGQAADPTSPIFTPPMKTQGAMVETWASPAISEQSLHEMRESLRQEMDMNNQIMLQQLKKRAGRLHDPNLSGELRPSQPPGGGSEENGQRHSEPGAQARKVDADAASTTAGTSPGSTPRRGIATLATKTATGLPVQGDDVQVSKTSGDAGSEEGGQSPQRKEVLEVRPPQVRLLRVGERDGRHERREEGGRPGRGGGADSGFIPEPKEVEEPEIGGGGSCGREHVSSMQQLVQGLPRIPEASGVSGDRRRRGDLGAAWQRCEGKKGVRWARRAQRGDNPFFVVDKEHYVMVNGEWERAHGNIEPGAKSVYVRASLTPRGQLECEEDRFNDQKLNRSERRRLAKAMRDRSEAVKISELYGPGRIQEAAEDLRMTTSSCFDLLTGWDLSQEAQRKAMWKALREEKPDFLIVSPPCTAFSQIQTTNWARMLPKKRVALLTAGLEHLQLAAAVMKWQLNRGRHILFEQPAGVTSWKEACIQSIAQRPEVHTIVNHQCQFGLNVDDLGPNKKPTRWMSSSQKVLSRLNRRCTGEHQHTPLQNGMPAKAAIYPPELCQAIALGVAEEMEPRECYAVEEEDGPEDGDPEEIHDEEGDGQGAVEQMKNRYSNRSGFAPVQRQIGQWPRVPTEITADNAIDPTLLDGVLTDDIEKLHEVRRIAHKAFCEYNADSTIKRALRSRPRVWRDFKAGEYVYVYRVPKVSREQCRHATNDERMGIEAVITECQDLIEQFQRNPDRAAYKDITEEGCPEEEEHEEVQAEARAVQFEPQVEEYEPTEYEAPEPEDQNAPEGTEEEPPKRRRSIAEPEQKAHPENQSGGETPAERWTHPAFPEGVPETPPVANVRPPLDALSPELQEAADRLDDVPGPVRWRQEPPGANPYFQESGWYLQPLEEESLEEEEHELDVARRRTLKECHDRKWKRDKWSFEWDKGQLIRHHERRRKAWFDPQVCDEPPVPMEFLKEEKTIKMKFNQNQEPKTLERFSLFLYVSFFLLWGSVATDSYLKGDFVETAHAHEQHRRLSGEGDISEEAGRRLAEPRSTGQADGGIIIASLSQSLQCLIVAPRLLQNMAKDGPSDETSGETDRLMPAFRPLEGLSSSGEPVRAHFLHRFGKREWCGVEEALLVLIGELELVAPLLSMQEATAATAATVGSVEVWTMGSNQGDAAMHRESSAQLLNGYKPHDTAPPKGVHPQRPHVPQPHAPRDAPRDAQLAAPREAEAREVPPWMQPPVRRNRHEVAVVPPWAQDTFAMPFPKREAPRRPSLQEPNRRKKEGENPMATEVRGQDAGPVRSAVPKVKHGCSVALVSQAVEPNFQYRPYMEDKYSIIDPFMEGELPNETWGFFAVYDGHGGAAAAEFCEAELHKVLASELRTALRAEKPRRPSSPVRDEVVAEALTRTFQKADEQLRSVGAWRFGCTATVCLVRRLPQSLRIHVANVGDSRAVSIDGSAGTQRLSMDHRPSDPAEARRVREEGGFVTMGRVAGELAISRALGDLLLKSSGLSCRPSVRAHDAKRDLALVVASDGLWDFVEEKDVGKVVTESSRNGLEHVAHRLVQEAQRSGSMDNISCLAIFL